MIRNIILIDRGILLIKHILLKTNWNIVVLVVETEKEKRQFLDSDRIFSVYTKKELMKINSVENLEFMDMRKTSKTQLKIENNFSRYIQDYQLGKYAFYSGWSFWKGVFDKNTIDLVIVKGLNHGFQCDIIPCDMATMRNIPSYNVESALGYTRSVYNNLKEKLIVLKEQSIKNIEKQKYYSMDINREPLIKSKLKKVAYKKIYALGGSLLIEFFVKLQKNKLFHKGEFEDNFFVKLWKYCLINNINRYLKSISTSINLGEKYIYFSLHMEPEAAISGRCLMDSQLVAIYMLANCLPKGWFLYVKEHPDQYRINNSLFIDFINSIAFFKSKRFYEKINKLKNVRIVHTYIPSRQLIENSKGIATMSGNVALEASDYKKPALLFSHDRSIFKYCNGYFNITSYKECQSAINEIVNGYIPNYNNLDLVAKTYLLEESEEGYSTAIDSIIQDIG